MCEQVKERTEERRTGFGPAVGFTIFRLRPTFQMTKYAVRPKSSSGPLHSSLRTLDSLRLTFRIAPYRSQKFRATRPGARPAVLKPRQATRAAPEEPDDLAFYHRLHSYRDRGDAGHRLQGGPEDDENGDWADESTLIAMLQDGYAYTLISRAARSCWTCHISQRSTRGRRL